MTQLHENTGPGSAPGVPAGETRKFRQWLWWPVVAGVAVGLLWWLLAPTGLNLITRDPALATGLEPAAWLPRDLTLAGLFVLAGCFSGALLVGRNPEFNQQKFAYALAGGIFGAVTAWQTGVLAAALLGGPVDASANASIAFSLRSLPVLLIWPGALAAVMFVKSLLSLSGRQSAEEVQGQHKTGLIVR